MDLIERDDFLNALQARFAGVERGEGHCILITGEAGIGKTSLVKAFCKEKKNECKIYQGTCDALFTPRPLAALYDIAWQIKDEPWETITDRSVLFAKLFHEIVDHKQTSIVIFEDIHWADEATLDFIKFLARRIIHTRCLFINTYRDNEVHSLHALRSVLGHLPVDSLTRLKLTPLSKNAVEKMAGEKGYSGENVFSISGGNPFYVNEILASYSPGIPDNIKDTILAVYNRQHEHTKRIWEIISVMPNGAEIGYLEKVQQDYVTAIEQSVDSGILMLKNGLVFFKHELYRRTVEASMSPFLRLRLNKQILDALLEKPEQEIERIIHHAKNANEYDVVVHYAPVAAKAAARLGAHVEAARLYFTAIEYYQERDKGVLAHLYEAFAYECYLTNQVKEAIIYQGKLLDIYKESNDKENIGKCTRFLSRLWWYDGNHKKAQLYANEAIGVLKDEPSSIAKAMAFSNMSQLKMLSNQPAECIYWGEKAIAIATELGDEEIMSHALNNLGTVQMQTEAHKEQGRKLLQQSLEIALSNLYHEHAARAYTNLGSACVATLEYDFAKKILDEGIDYCEKRDLDSWTSYMLSRKAVLCLETGNWDEAYAIAGNLVKNENQAPISRIGALIVLATIKMRRGDTDVSPLLYEAKEKAFEAGEAQRIVPATVALLEYEWLTGKTLFENAEIDNTIDLVKQTGNIYEISEFAFWLQKVKKQNFAPVETLAAYQVGAARKAATIWEQLGCPYKQALMLFEGNDNDKKEAIKIVQLLHADAVYEKMKLEMRTSGIKSIPRGIRKSTQANSAHLTTRELDVLILLKDGMQNKEIADRLFISAKTVDHHISSILFKLDVNSRAKAVQQAIRLEIIK